jgi:hypothetical protein
MSTLLPFMCSAQSDCLLPYVPAHSVHVPRPSQQLRAICNGPKSAKRSLLFQRTLTGAFPLQLGSDCDRLQAVVRALVAHGPQDPGRPAGRSNMANSGLPIMLLLILKTDCRLQAF